MRTDNLPQATTLSLTDEFIGNTSLETVRATLQVLLTLFSANLITSGTSAPTSETAGLIYMMIENGAISTVYGKVNNQWLAFSSGGGGGSTVAIEQIVTSGTELAQLIIDGVTTSIYAPSGGGFTPTLLQTFDTSAAQSSNTTLTVTGDMSQYNWIILELEKTNEMMAGYSGPFRSIMWIPVDSMGNGESGTTSEQVGVSYNEEIPTSGSVINNVDMISIKDAHTLYLIYMSNFKVRRVFGL